MAMDAKAKALKALGKDVIAMGIGQPDFPTPENVKEAGKRAIDANFTGYTVNQGIVELRQAIAAKYSTTPEQVTVSAGAKQPLYNSLLALANPGDDVVVQNPAWVSIPEQVKIAGATPVAAQMPEPFEFKAEPILAAITPKTSVVMLNSPCNPTGAVAPEGELRKLAEGLAEHEKVFVISDEVYEEFLYDGAAFHSPYAYEAIRNRVVRINAFSKTYSMTGWRIGYSIAPQEVAKAINNIQSHITGNANSIAQKAALEAITGPQDRVKEMVAEFDARRKIFFDEIKACGFKCTPPQGAFYLFADISSTGMDGDAFCARLLDEALVAAVPGGAFGAPNYVRFSYATTRENLAKAGGRIREFVAGLKR